MYTFLKRSIVAAQASAIAAVTGVSSALAESFGGPSANTSTPVTAGEPREIIENVLSYILGFLALIAVIVIIIAGFRLIFSQGEEGAKDKAKKTIFYAIIGLIVIVFAEFLVSFFLGASYVS
jgi:type IV secretory pathway VirB2 component (pilin)